MIWPIELGVGHARLGADADRGRACRACRTAAARSRGRRPRSWCLPIEPTDPKRTMPLTRYFASGPSPNAPTVWPTAKCCSSAVDLSIAICPSPWGHCPSRAVSGFRLWSPRCGSMPKATPSSAFPIALPFASTSRDWSSIEPCATRTPGRRLDLGQHVGRERRRLVWSRRSILIASFELMTASVALYDSL